MGLRLVKELIKPPIPEPFTVFVLSVVVGFWASAQQIPLEVTGLPPSEMTVPTQVAELVVMEVIAEVTIPASMMEVLKFTSFP